MIYERFLFNSRNLLLRMKLVQMYSANAARGKGPIFGYR